MTTNLRRNEEPVLPILQIDTIKLNLGMKKLSPETSKATIGAFHLLGPPL